MKSSRWLVGLLFLALVSIPGAAWARGLAVELWTDRGNDGVYQPGDVISIKTRLSEDAFLLVYEIDSEGGVHVIYPPEGTNGPVQGGREMELPDDNQNQLVVDEQTGQGFVVALASRAPFGDLPWYLRPVNPQAEANGYVGKPNEEEGVTEDGKIVGDPFVAMEKIRRRVIANPDDADGFATTYVTYYVHEQVKYPRYLCYDCHRPGHYAWWDGFDPYYTTCSAFEFHVNWSWYWGPTYWFGSVPYFVFVYRDNCPPLYRYPYGPGATWYSSWDGWHRWVNNWGSGGLVRYKSDPPPNYTPPTAYKEAIRVGRPLPTPPPGILANSFQKQGGIRTSVPIGRSNREGGETGAPRLNEVGRGSRGLGAIERGQLRPWDGVQRGADPSIPRAMRGGSVGPGGFQRMPVESPRVERTGGGMPRREFQYAPRVERARGGQSGGGQSGGGQRMGGQRSSGERAPSGGGQNGGGGQGAGRSSRPEGGGWSGGGRQSR